MRPKKVEQDDLLYHLMTVLRAKGYDGASLSDLSDASGLQKASLYHRFPGGKQEIATAVMEYVDEEIQREIYDFLHNEEISADDRRDQVLNYINDRYDEGIENCILRTMTMDSSYGFLSEQLSVTMNKWKDGFIKLGLDLDMRVAEAVYKAEQSIILIQGSLVMSKSLGTNAPFQTTMLKIKVMYTP